MLILGSVEQYHLRPFCGSFGTWTHCLKGEDALCPQRVKLASADFDRLEKDDIILKWRLQEDYIDFLEDRVNATTSTSSNDEQVDKLKAQVNELAKRENVLAMRLVTKDQEQQDLLNQISDLKSAAAPGASALHSHLVDPAVNYVFWSIKKEQQAMKQKLEDTQNELKAWKFTPDSQRGKMLMAKCRQLHQENEELGKEISSGRLAKIEGELAIQKNFCKELKKTQTELAELLGDQDEDIEGMQSVIYLLQRQVKQLKEENSQLKAAQVEPGAIDNDVDMDIGFNEVVAVPSDRKVVLPSVLDHNDVDEEDEDLPTDKSEEAEARVINGISGADVEEEEEEDDVVVGGDVVEADSDIKEDNNTNTRKLTQSELVSSSRDRDQYLNNKGALSSLYEVSSTKRTQTGGATSSLLRSPVVVVSVGNSGGGGDDGDSVSVADDARDRFRWTSSQEQPVSSSNVALPRNKRVLNGGASSLSLMSSSSLCKQVRVSDDEAVTQDGAVDGSDVSGEAVGLQEEPDDEGSQVLGVPFASNDSNSLCNGLS
ncbi:unnamed protein product [Notodromas monacha]|uniref:Pre-mRNA-splicing regulator WTAP n=1 Tax=Notodromas monacha TaxID=399045 RepID=A0A7R9BXE7_9CRUS|nr:unnamed protein product [Notodromas monacha]CAG0923476.1 unnamed protein product [Notodromas monacha]